MLRPIIVCGIELSKLVIRGGRAVTDAGWAEGSVVELRISLPSR